ncbi:MAG: glutathione S-transferase family protein [Geminicoccaceae bacterium]|nr:MAG: glutathione S-transferase family protein [Geminicoccaceae bacterium]
MLRIWGRLNSVNVAKVVWCAAEMDLPFQRIDAGGKFGRLDDASYGAKNPNRKIPTLEDGGLILWESHAILRYLGARYGEGSLWPSDPVARAPMDAWLDWVHTEGYFHMRDVFWQLIRTPAEERDLDLVERQRQALDPKMGIVDAQLANSRYIAGPTFTLADIPMGLLADRWFRLDIQRSPYPHLRRWYDDLAARPAFQTYCAQPLT